MEKLCLEFKLLSESDGKVNIYGITSITIMENKTYTISKKLPSADFHTDIPKAYKFAKVKKSLVKRF